MGKGPPRGSVLLGKYRVESTLGFGGMGLVIKAKNLALDEHVAIKLMREDVEVDDEHVMRFVREAKNAVKLKSEHVARIRDVGTFDDDGRPYMVMELLEGQDLGKLLLDIGALERARAVDLVLQACDALAEAHALGIVHRDIKPTNLFITKRRDGSDLLKVLDFGISKATLGAGPDMELTQTQSMLGTPADMSPEQMRSARTVDPRSDIWSLGCVLYELVEGHPPFDASNFAELCVMVSIEPFTPLVAAPELTPVIERVLAKKPDERFQTVADLAHALEPYASDRAAARRQVTRVFRVLGLAHPDGRDSTPMAFERKSESKLSYAALPHTPLPASYDLRPSRWKPVAFLAGIAALGIAGALMFVSGTEHEKAARPAVEDVVEPPAATLDAHAMTVERPDAALPIDAAAAVPAIEIANPPPKKPAPKKPPRKITKPAVKPPPKPVAPPPKPRCDPFDHKNGC